MGVAGENKGLFGLHAPDTRQGQLEPINEHMRLHREFSEQRLAQERARDARRTRSLQHKPKNSSRTHKTGARRVWSEEEDAIVLDPPEDFTLRQVAEYLGRSYASVTSRRRFLAQFGRIEGRQVRRSRAKEDTHADAERSAEHEQGSRFREL